MEGAQHLIFFPRALRVYHTFESHRPLYVTQGGLAQITSIMYLPVDLLLKIQGRNLLPLSFLRRVHLSNRVKLVAQVPNPQLLLNDQAGATRSFVGGVESVWGCTWVPWWHHLSLILGTRVNRQLAEVLRARHREATGPVRVRAPRSRAPAVHGRVQVAGHRAHPAHPAAARSPAVGGS